MFELITKQDIEDFTNGCCFFGTGGGGNAEFGQAMLLEALAADKKIQIVDSDSIHDDDWIVCPYLMGTSGPETDEVKTSKHKMGLTQKTVSNMSTVATNLLLKHAKLPTQLSAIIPYEIGGAATASAVSTAAWLNIPTIDADFVGRAVPEATQMLPSVHGLDLSPTASADAYGNEAIIYKTLNRNMLERMGKYLSQASFGLIGQATLLHKKRILKKFMLTKTLSKALSVGQALRLCCNDHRLIEKTIHKISLSKKIFSGMITSIIGNDEEGYYVGEILINGTDDYKRTTFKIWFKNENHIAWLNDAVCMTSPDLISIIDQNSCLPLVNNQLKKGLYVEVYGTPSNSVWHQPETIIFNCPRYYGFDMDAKSI